MCSVRELAELFAAQRQGVKVRYVASAKSQEYLNTQTGYFVGKNGKLRSLGWKEETSLEEGISRLVRWAAESDFLAEV